MGYAPHGSLCTSQDCRFPSLVSPFLNPMAIATDVFLFSWDHIDLHAFPLFPAIRHILSKMWSSQRTYIILIALFWPSKEWFPDLLQVTISAPRLLLMCPDLLQQPQFHRFHDGPHELQLTMWKLSSDSSVLRAFPESCNIPGEISVAFNYCVLPMQVEAVQPVVPRGSHYQHFPVKVQGFPFTLASGLSSFSLRSRDTRLCLTVSSI